MTPIERHARIQALRGLACVLLVLYHVVGDRPANGLRVDEGPVRWLNDGLAYLRMPLFTFLSGWVYGMRPMEGAFGQFVKGKARRLLVPMLSVGTLFALVQACIPGSNAAVQNWYALHIQPVAHYWYLESLFWVFLAVGLLDQWGSLRKPFVFACTFCAVIVLYLNVRGPHVLGIEGALYLAPYFLLGLTLSRFKIWGILMHRGSLILIWGVSLMAMVQMGLPVPNPDRRSPEMLLAGLGLCLLVTHLPLKGFFWVRLGSSSYAIYLFHVFFTAASRIGTEKASWTWLPFQLVLGTLLGIVGPMLVEKLASKNHLSALMLLGKAVPKRTRSQGRPT